MPHTGGIAVGSIPFLYHPADTRCEILQPPVNNIQIHSVSQGAVILHLPEMIVDFHNRTKFTQYFLPLTGREFSLQINIYIIIGFFIRFSCCPGSTERNRFHSGTSGQPFPKPVYICFRHIYSHPRIFLRLSIKARAVQCNQYTTYLRS